MKYYATCPVCGKKLCKAGEGSLIEMRCPNCNEAVEVSITKETVSTRACSKLATKAS